jgi:transaldolase
MAKEGIKGTEAVMQHYRDICELVDGDISAEVISTDFDGIVAEGKILAALHKNIVVKVPMVKDGIKAIKWFTDNGIRTNCTLVFSAGQAILAAKAGASYVSPFIGRIDDSGWDGMDLIHQLRQIFSIQGYKTEILAASIRNPNHIIKCAEAGADVCTCPLSSILGLLKHPLTDIGLAQFLEDAKKFA